ncbi:MAG: hypothetical protein MMC23_005401 [Stictis urceolatum]|nr:hypothetical protein [Stictis urceolata]
MASLLRRKLQCFYCGRRSAQSYSAGLSQWHCENCDAVNYLDQNGDITDPPATITAPLNNQYGRPQAIRFASQTGRSISPPTTSQDSIFCQRCLTNQSLLTQKLSQYLPSTDDPRYEEFLSKSPEYQRSLQDRYPQVCRDCEPRVQARIREAGYAAKTDHLRRMMEQTSTTRKTRPGNGWYGLWVRFEAICWWLSLLGQVVWHSLGAFANTISELGVIDAPRNLQQCIKNARTDGIIDESCVSHATWVATASLVLALLSLRFNPAMLKGPLRRATGLGEYYKLQLILNVLRLIAWSLLGDVSVHELELSKFKAMHAVMLALNVVVSLIAYRTARIDTRPQTLFKDEYEPLIARQTPVQGSSLGQQGYTQANSQATVSQPEQFPINSLASPRQRSATPGYPPTPPPEDDESDDASTVAESSIADVDAMDLDTPVKDQFAFPRPRPYKPTPPKPGKSPFHGTLPAAPVSQAHKLRNPFKAPIFQKASDSSHRNYFGDVNRESGTVAQSKSEHDDTPKKYEMAPPRFFTSRSDEDTGLEALFKGIFSLNDDPPELRTMQPSSIPTEQPAAPSTKHTVSTRTQRLISASALCFSLYIWWTTSTSTASTLSHPLRLAALSITSLVAGHRLAEALRPTRTVWLISDILFLAAELGIALGLAYELHTTRHAPAEFETSFGTKPLLFLAAMTVQESFSCISELFRLRAPNEPSAPPPAPSEHLDSHMQSPSPTPTEKPSSRPQPLPAKISNPPRQTPTPGISSTPLRQLNNFNNTPARSTRSQTRALGHGDPAGRRDSIGSASGFAGLSLGNSPDVSVKGRMGRGGGGGRGGGRAVPPWERGGVVS